MPFIAAYWPVFASAMMAGGLVLWWRARRRSRVVVLQAGSPRQTWFPLGTRDRDLDEESDPADRSGGDDGAGD